MDEFRETLENYLQRFRVQRPSQQVLLEAAGDLRLPTRKLIAEALRDFIMERRADARGEHLALMILQQRASEDVIVASMELLDNENESARILGAKILRELPCLDQAPYPHSMRVLEALKKSVAVEKQEEALIWALSAVGWQCHPTGLDILLGFLDDDRVDVRRTVGDNLLHCCHKERPIPSDVVAALLQLASDEDADIRWSVFYDIGEFPAFYLDCRQLFSEAAIRAESDTDSKVREQARRARVELDRLGRPRGE